MSKLEVASTDFTIELAPASVESAAKAASATAVKGGAGAVYKTPYKSITPIAGFNVRVDTPDYLAHIATLKASIKSEGFYDDKPLAGYADKTADGTSLLLTDGYTRYRALGELIADPAEAEFTEDFPVPFIAKAQGQSLEDLTVALVNGNEGRPLSVYEKAIVAKRLITMGVEPKRVADRLNMTERYVADLMLLAGSSTKVRNLVISGKVSSTEAIKQIRKDAKGAGDTLETATKAAAAAGKKKATGKDVKKAKGGADSQVDEESEGVTSSAVTKNGKVTTTITYHFKQGAIVDTDKIKPVRFFNDSTWWDFVDPTTDKEHVVINETIKIKVVIVTAEKTDDDTFADPDAQASLSGGEADDTFADGEEKPATETEEEKPADEEL